MTKSQVRVNKASFLDALDCRTRGWLTRHGEFESSEGDELRKVEGMDVGRRVRSLYPAGELVDESSLLSAAKRTQELMSDQTVSTIFEATFLIGEYATKVDILTRAGRGWKLLEVKSAVNPSEAYLQDLAYTLMVVRQAGVKIRSSGLVLLSPDFRLGMDDRRLFQEHDYTSEAGKLADSFDGLWDEVAGSILSSQCPDPELIFACRSCPYCEDCHDSTDSDHIFDLPRLSESLFKKLVNRNCLTISEIPEEMLSVSQNRVRKAVVSGKPVINKSELAQLLKNIEWPAYYLDFETVKSAIPLFPGIAPHEQIVTQYSIHVCDSPGKVHEHREFLSDATSDQRRTLVERLLADLGRQGSIVVYSSFEKTMLNGLIRLFPDHRRKLQQCVNRLFDLEKAFREHVYFPGFRGRTSIKVTLPTMVGETYDGLDICDGDTAVAMYARMARGEITGLKAKAVRQALLAYCQQDTYGMVLLHGELEVIAGRIRSK